MRGEVMKDGNDMALLDFITDVKSGKYGSVNNDIVKEERMEDFTVEDYSEEIYYYSIR